MRVCLAWFLFGVFPLFAEEDGPPNTVLEELRAFIAAQTEAGTIDRDAEGWRTRLPKFPEVPFEDGARYLWVLHTSEGDLTAELNHEAAPQHVRNILYLTELGYYDGLKFHRIIPGFMAQGGCPLGRGNGGPGYSIRLETTPKAKHDAPGVLSMARSANPNSAGSQFFLTFAPQPRLDGGYTVFGRMVEGEDTLKKLEAAGNPNPRSNGVPPRKTITITSAEIRVREAAADAP